MAPQREWFEKNYYEVLGVDEKAAAKDITRAYRKLARQHHPDANPGNDSSEERFKEISAAYDVLGDEAKRKEYDEVRRLGPMASGYGPPGGGNVRFEEGGDLSGLFAQFFGGGNQGGGRASRARGAGPARGADLEAELTLSFADAVHGVTTAVHLTSDAACETCKGSGSRPGTVPQTCTACNGRGVTDENQGFFSFSQPCRVCGGRGRIITDPCPDCRGSGTRRRAREVKVRVPAGVDDGQRIRLKGRGEPGRNNGPAGDLFVTVRVSPHELFGRKGDNLTLEVPVTFAEAALGSDIKVPTLDGEPVTIRIPPGTRSGRTLRVKGRGIDHGRRVGDLLVTVDVAVPTKLSAEERRAVEALAAAAKESPRDYLGLG
ncbi:MAG: molecular chaperone DnaJ [Actinobacteria bacterium]|jgi:molecular chaperone DnaJ|nr:MAG: molecular chaperone DnaJ [Actinomycetota bacterium]